MESDDLSQLMPNIQQRALQQVSPSNTQGLREYIKVLGDKNGPGAASTLPHKPRTAGLALRAGTGRRPQRRYFTIKLRPEDLDPEQRQLAEQAQQAALDPEALKDALLEQARVQRRALMEATLRPGTGRMPRRREFAVTLPPMQLEEPEAEAAEEEEQEQFVGEAEEEEEEERLLQLEEGDGELMEAQQQWEAEQGVLAEAQKQAQLQPAAATPGTALWLQQQQEQQQEGQPPLSQQQQQDSQRAQAKTPGTSGQYTPMEGVPERMLLATRGKQLPLTVSRLGLAAAGTPAGFTPLEGVPELAMVFQPLPGGPRLLGLPGATLVCSNEGQQPSVDSPVEGLLQEGARRSKEDVGVPRPADGFAFAQLPSPAGGVEGQEDDGDDDMGGGFDEDGGFDDGGYEGEPSPSGQDEAPGAFPFPAGGGSPVQMADAGMQTGTSLAAEDEEQAAAAADAAAAGALHEDAYGDAGGGFEDAGAYEQPGVDADLPESSGAAEQRAQQAHRAQRKVTKNPGSRLRNELKRKSLAIDPLIGRHEVLGMRRSCRAPQEPLKWWLNEKKEFGREHQTMPTIHHVVHKVPNTPWQTVTDFKPKRRNRKKQRAATPHDLGQAMAAEEMGQQSEEEAEAEEAAAAGEEEQQEEEEAAEEEVEEEEQQQEEAAAADEAEEEQQQQEEEEDGEQPRRSGRGRQPAGPRRSGKAGAAAHPPGAKAKPTKKKAAGRRRR